MPLGDYSPLLTPDPSAVSREENGYQHPRSCDQSFEALQQAGCRYLKLSMCDFCVYQPQSSKHFPIHLEWIATFLSVHYIGLLARYALVRTSSQKMSDRLSSGVTYFVRMPPDRDPSVILAEVSYPVLRLDVSCAGLKSCSCSVV